MNINILKNTLFLLLLVTIVSCSNTEDDLFDAPASVRQQEFQKKTKKDLEEASQWLFQYFPDSKQKYGGVNYYLKFKDGKVTAKIDGSNKEETSEYVLLSRGGTILSFDLYNSLLHLYAEPSSSETEGKGGDFEFLVLNQDKNVINLKGLKSGNYMKLIKFDGNIEEYKQKVEANLALLNKFNFPVKGKINGEEFFLKTNGEKNVILTKDKESEDGEELAYIVTDKGIRFYKPLEANGIKYYELLFDKENKKLYSEDKKIEFEYNLILINFRATSWSLDISNDTHRSDIFKRNWDADRGIVIAFFNGFDLSPNYTLGNTNGDIGYFMSLVHKASGGAVPIGFGLDFTIDATNTKIVNIEKKKPLSDQLGFVFKFVNGMLNVISNNAPYEMEVDNEDDPKEVKLTSKANPEVWFILTKK